MMRRAMIMSNQMYFLRQQKIAYDASLIEPLSSLILLIETGNTKNKYHEGGGET